MSRNEQLTRREREILEILHRDGELTASQLVERLAGSRTNSTVRTLLRILEEKGHVQHHRQGLSYVYRPRESRDRAQRKALKHLVSTFFGGSPESVVTAMLDERSMKLSRAQLDALAQLIEQAKKEGR